MMTEDELVEELLEPEGQPIDSELLDMLTEIEEEGEESEFDRPVITKSDQDSHVVFLKYHNAMSDDLQTIEAFLAISSEELRRVVVLRATWDASSPRQPTDITANFYTDLEEGRRAAIQMGRSFRKFVVDGEYKKRDFEITFSRLAGFSQLHALGGVADNIKGSFGRHANSILSFLSGGEDYEKVDLTYNNAWGAW